MTNIATYIIYREQCTIFRLFYHYLVTCYSFQKNKDTQDESFEGMVGLTVLYYKHNQTIKQTKAAQTLQTGAKTYDLPLEIVVKHDYFLQLKACLFTKY